MLYRIFHDGAKIKDQEWRPFQLDLLDNCHCDDVTGDRCHVAQILELKRVVMDVDLELNQPVVHCYFQTVWALPLVETLQ